MPKIFLKCEESKILVFIKVISSKIEYKFLSIDEKMVWKIVLIELIMSSVIFTSSSNKSHPIKLEI